jgi:hypothetical protein
VNKYRQNQPFARFVTPKLQQKALHPVSVKLTVISVFSLFVVKAAVHLPNKYLFLKEKFFHETMAQYAGSGLLFARPYCPDFT